MKKSIIVSLLLSAVLFVFLGLHAFGADKTVLTAADVAAQSGDTVEVAITMQGNTGLRALGFDLNYDTDALELVNAKDANAKLFDGFMYSENASETGWRFAFVGMEPSDANGTVLKLSFKVNAEDGSYPIAVKVTKASTTDPDGALRQIDVQTVNGSVSVGNSMMEISAATVSAESGKTVDVAISVDGNTGLRALGFDVAYDAEALELTNAKEANAKLFDGFMYSENASDTGWRFAFVGMEASDANGTVLNLKFKVLAEDGTYPITVKVTKASATNADGTIRQLAVKTTAGAVSVSAPTTEAPTTEAPTTEAPTTEAPTTEAPTTEPSGGIEVYLGDADLDGRVKATDARKILRHAAKLELLTDPMAIFVADVDQDGKIKAGDARLALRMASRLDPLQTAEYSGESSAPAPETSETETPVTKNEASGDASFVLSMPDSVTAGEEFSVTAALKNAKGFTSGDFNLSWDPDVLQCVDVAPNDEFSINTIEADKIGAIYYNEEDSEVIISSFVDDEYPSDTMLIARFTFIAGEDVDAKTEIKFTCRDAGGVDKPDDVSHSVGIS